MIPDSLREAEFINLLTIRKNGDGVPTPVWAARIEESLYVFSQGQAGKIKRIRNSGDVRVAECTANGKLKGYWHVAKATLVESGSPEEAAAYEALLSKYGWKIKILNFGSKLAGKAKTRVVVRLDF